jgi:hypothetical protein
MQRKRKNWVISNLRDKCSQGGEKGKKEEENGYTMGDRERTQCYRKRR